MSGCSRLTRRRFRRDPTHALFADQSQSIPDNLVALLGQIRAWNYLADTARSAGSLFASQRVRKLNRARRTRWHPVGGGSLNRRVRLMRLTCHAAERPAQPEMTQPVWKPSLCPRMKNIWKVIGRLTDHDCEISSTSDQILPAGGVWVGFHTGWDPKETCNGTLIDHEFSN